MTPLVTALPHRRSDLVIRPLGGGRYVVKDPVTGGYFELGEQEHFLLAQLDGEQTPEDVSRAFEGRFGEPLPEEDLEGFLDLATEQGFLPLAEEEPPDPVWDADRRPALAPTPSRPAASAAPPAPGRTWSLLYWRVSLFDPDRLFTRLAPKVWFLWTRGFLVLSVAAIATAGVVVWANQGALISRFADALNWRTALIVWVTLLAATTLHEFAHGLTCKHYGGEVHEVGFLAMFFLPCLYCNVSDAWLIPERRRRLLVTLAGGYCDLCLWALAVFAWRLTPPEGLANYIAWVVLSVLGARVFFNFNPLLKLDGYYLLSDWKGVPNLHQRGADRAKAHLRRVLWGADPPPPDPRGRFLTAYGLASWAFSVAFLGLMLVGLARYLWSSWGLVALAVVPLGWVTGRGLVAGLTGGEVGAMIRQRRLRAGVWVLGLGAAAAALFWVEVGDRAGGPFQVRAAGRAEVRAPVSGFLREVCHDEGDRVSPGAVVARLEVPDLDARVSQKGAEAREAGAKLRLLEAGPRPEEVEEQRRRVARARDWRDRAREDLSRAKSALREDLALLDERVLECEADIRFARKMFEMAERLRQNGAGSGETWLEAVRRLDVSRSRLAQVQAQKRSLEAAGTREAEAELARRGKELADAEGALALLETGSRPEEVDAARAHLARVREELRHLEEVRGKLVVRSPVGGVLTTPRPRDRVGHYVREGDLICVVEDPSAVEIEVAVAEQDVARVRPGQPAEFRARALPFETVRGRVERVAPAATRPEPNPAAPPAARGEAPGTVIVYCRVDGPHPDLRPGETGHARVSCGSRPVGELLRDRAVRFLRAEFWW